MRATLHVIARTTSGGSTDTVAMKFFNNGTIAGTGSAKTLTSTYHGIDFTASISDVKQCHDGGRPGRQHRRR